MTTTQPIATLFDKDIHRRIEEVIKVDQTDEEIIRDEINEYVVTDVIRTHYTNIFDAYRETPNKPHEGIAVWVSGFFGSGKSSFAKMLGLSIANRMVAGEPAGERFARRARGDKLQVLLKAINEKIPTHAVIFDVSTDRGIRSGNQTLTEIMYGLFLQSLGYAKDLDLSELEIGLEKKGQLTRFEEEYQKIYTKDWSAEKGKVAFALSEASRVQHNLDPASRSSTARPMTATWRGLLAIALLASLYLIPVTLISCGLFFIWFFQVDEGISAGWVFIAVLQGLWFWWILFAWLTAAGVTGTPQDASAAISREQAPDLWDQVTALARQVKTRPPTELRLYAAANAEVVEETRLAGLIPVTRRMYLGIPLLVTLPPGQLAAVMGHELGHYARGHTRVGPVCYRARAAADQLLHRLNLATAWGKAPLRTKLLRWIILRYSEIYSRLSSPVTQDQEFQADAKAAQIMGPQQTAAALCGVHAVLVAWDSFVAGARDEDLEWAPDPFDEFRERWRYHHVRAEAAEMAAGAVHDPFGTHPPLHERLARLLGDQAETMATDWVNAPAAPLAATAPEVPLAARERIRLFRDEVRTRRERAARRERAPAVPARPSRLAVLRVFPLLLEKHPAAAAMAAIIVLTVAGFGGFEGHEHIRAPAPAAAVSASPALPDVQVPSSQPAPAASTPAPQPSDIPSIPNFSIIPPIVVSYVTIVRPGDTLSSIASCWHSTVAAIQRLNHLGKSTLIRPGEQLQIPLTGPSGQPLNPPTGPSGYC